MDLFLREATDRIGIDDPLFKIDRLLDWTAFSSILKRGLGRSGLGPSGYNPLTLFKCLLVGRWHGLSDPKLERALSVRLDFMLFCGLDLHGPVPDETTHCRFRNALVKADVYDELLAEVCSQIEHHGLKVKEAEAAIIDATLIESAARPRTHIEAPQDREEGDADDPQEVHYSADDDARWVKKGRKSTLGFKGFARTDEEGFVDKVHVTPANVGESPQFGTMIEGSKAQRVMSTVTASGHAAVVRNGYHPERAIQTGIGPVSVRIPKVRSKDGTPVTFRSALVPPYPTTRHQRCWQHKTMNVLNCLPNLSQPKAKKALHDIWQAETKNDADKAFDLFIKTYEAKYPKAVLCLQKDREELMAFFDFPAQHWISIRTTNPIESTFATIRHRTKRSKGCLNRDGMLHMMFKLGECAEGNWRKLRGFNYLAKVIAGVAFKDGIETNQEDQIAA